MRRRSVAAVALIVLLGGCGSSSARRGVSLAEACRRVSAEISGVNRRLTGGLYGNGQVTTASSTRAARLRNGVGAAAREDLRAVGVAEDEIRRMAPTLETRLALTRLAESRRRLGAAAELAERNPEGVLALEGVLDLGEARGGCRHIRAAIGG
jgi:hypothetical protein